MTPQQQTRSPLQPTYLLSQFRVEGQSYLPQEHTSPLFWFGAVTPEYFRLPAYPDSSRKSIR